MEAALTVGGVPLEPPVVLAPMAGITNRAFRRLCREYGGGLFVSEMITSRALVERNDKTMVMSSFEADESPRSIQLYGVSRSGDRRGCSAHHCERGSGRPH